MCLRATWLLDGLYRLRTISNAFSLDGASSADILVPGKVNVIFPAAPTRELIWDVDAVSLLSDSEFALATKGMLALHLRRGDSGSADGQESDDGGELHGVGR
jgi:hypothetical protein